METSSTYHSFTLQIQIKTTSLYLGINIISNIIRIAYYHLKSNESDICNIHFTYSTWTFSRNPAFNLVFKIS